MSDHQQCPESHAHNRRRFEAAPCFLCGYNGERYFQPETHHCANYYHGYKPWPDSNGTGRKPVASGPACFHRKSERKDDGSVRCVDCDEVLMEASKPVASEAVGSMTLSGHLRSWADGRPTIQTNHALLLRRAADQLDAYDAKVAECAAKDARIAERNREAQHLIDTREVAYVERDGLLVDNTRLREALQACMVLTRSLQPDADKINAIRDVLTEALAPPPAPEVPRG